MYSVDDNLKASTTFVLLNGERASTLNPTTFRIPPAHKRYALPLETKVKVGLIIPEQFTDEGMGGERPWLQITHIERRDADTIIYEGEFITKPSMVDASLGDKIFFFPEHVIAIDEEGE